MPEQVHAERPKREYEELAEVDAVEQSEHASTVRDKLPELDDLLDEIEGVLEENAEEFVNSYRQKGGQ